MAASFIYKPGTSKGPVVLVPSEGPRSGVTITTKDGKTYQGSYLNTNEGRHQYVFPTELYGQEGLQISYNGVTGSIPNGSKALEGSDITGWQARPGDKGSIVDGQVVGGVAGSSGVQPGFEAGQVGFGAVPKYLGNEYPDPVFTDFTGIKAPSIKSAPYKYVDPQAFASTFGAFNRQEFVKNASISKNLALDQLDTELQGLQGYVPAAAALKRGETAADNTFNQQERSRQIDSALPNAKGDLEAQRVRAASYASGKLPDAVADRGLELGVRSAAADTAYAGGFGTGSVASSNLSDQMSAEQRFKIAQYGEQQVSGNLKDTASLLLAPTEYSNAGGQISVVPSHSGSELQSNLFKDINALTTIDPSQALSSVVNQNQFASNLTQRTREFNASNKIQVGEFNSTGNFNESTQNAGIANQFSLGKFNYDVTYAGAVAGATQLNTNTQLSLDQQAQYAQIFKDFLSKAQSAQQTGAIVQGIAAALPTILSSLGVGKTAATPTTPTTGSATPGSAGGSLTAGAGTSDTTVDTENGPNSSPPKDNPPGTELNSDGAIVLPTGSEMPDGYHATETVDGGKIIEPGDSSTSSLPTPEDGFHFEPNESGDGVIQVPDSTPAVAANMSEDGFNTESLSVKSNSRALEIQTKATNNSMGVSSKPTPDSVLTGYTNQGQPQYSIRSLALSNNPTAGAQHVNTLQTMMAPLGVLNNKTDASNLQTVAAGAGDAAFAAKLTDLYQKGDRAGFAAAILNKFQKPIFDNLGVGPKTQETAATLVSAYNLYNQWDKLSPTQKSIGLASLGLQAIKTTTGTNLASTPIIKASPGNPGLTVGQGLALFQAGYNTYTIAKNWNQLNTVQKIAAGSSDVSQIANLAQSFKTAGTTASAGANATAGTASAGGSAGAGSVASAFGDVYGVAALTLGAKQITDSWGQGGKQATITGALGGATVAAGLYTLAGTNSYVLAGVVAASALGANLKSEDSQRVAKAASAFNPVDITSAKNTIKNLAIIAVNPLAAPLKAYEAFKSGKSAEQLGRDSVRTNLQNLGAADKKYAVTLADGTKADIGADGTTGSRNVSDPSKWVGKAPSKLHSYDVDYTNDLDYAAGMGGIALARITSGGKNTPIDQVGGQIGNATLANIGHGKDLSQANFSKLAQNQRAVYAQSGIKSKADAYALAEQAFKEGRLDATDLVTAQQAFNMIYDNNGYQTAQKLMSGRYRGIEVATKDPAPTSDVPNKPVSTTSTPAPTSSSFLRSQPALTKAEIIAQNKNRFGALDQIQGNPNN